MFVNDKIGSNANDDDDDDNNNNNNNTLSQLFDIFCQCQYLR